MPSSLRVSDADALYRGIEALKAEQERREADCLAAILEVRAAGGGFSPSDEDEDTFERRIRHGAGIGKTYTVPKFSPNGNFIGWSRKGQKGGMPNRRMPIEQDVDAAFEHYANELKKCIGPAGRQAYRCQKSRQARAQSDNLAKKIPAMYMKLVEGGVKKSARVKTIARNLECEPEYVRRVLRKSSLV